MGQRQPGHLIPAGDILPLQATFHRSSPHIPMVCDHSMCELRRLCRHAEQPAQQSPHPTGRPPDDDPHALTSCPSSTRCRRRSAKTTPGTLSSPPGTPPRSGYPVPIPAHKCPTSSSRPIFAPYIPPPAPVYEAQKAECIALRFFTSSARPAGPSVRHRAADSSCGGWRGYHRPSPPAAHGTLFPLCGYSR